MHLIMESNTGVDEEERMKFLSNWREFRIFQQQQNHLVSSFLIAQKTKSLKRLIIKNAIRVSPMGIVISLLWRSNFLSDLHRNHLKLPICRYTSFWSSQLFASVLKSSMAHFMLLNREGSKALNQNTTTFQESQFTKLQSTLQF